MSKYILIGIFLSNYVMKCFLDAKTYHNIFFCIIEIFYIKNRFQVGSQILFTLLLLKDFKWFFLHLILKHKTCTFKILDEIKKTRKKFTNNI